MSVYFNNRGGYKFDRVLEQTDRNKKIINELARRRNISIAEKGKKKKRKPKSKGKHRKKGKDKSEITIDNQPTQRVAGYNVVNVISAKRGKYKPRKQDKDYPDVAPNWFKEGKGRKGTAWKFSQKGMASGSDNRYEGDPKEREQLKLLRRQVQRIEDRLMGMGNNPAQPNQAGPVQAGAAPNSGGGGVGTGNIPKSKGAPAQSKGKGAPPPPSTPFGGRTLAPAVAPGPPVISLQDQLLSEIRSATTARAAVAADNRQRAREQRGTPKPKRSPVKIGTPPEDYYRDWAAAERVRKEGSPALSLRSSQKSKESDLIRQEEADMGGPGGQRPLPRSTERLIEGAEFFKKLKESPKAKTPSPPVSVPSTPQLYTAAGGFVDVSGGLPSKPHPVSPELVRSSPTITEARAERREKSPSPPASPKQVSPVVRYQGAQLGAKRAAQLDPRYQGWRDTQSQIANELYNQGFLPDKAFAQRSGKILKERGGLVKLTKGKIKLQVIEHMKKENRSKEEIAAVSAQLDENRRIRTLMTQEYTATPMIAEEDTLPENPIENPLFGSVSGPEPPTSPHSPIEDEFE